MSTVYIHIPFCKKACYYCNFHFSTNLKYKEKLINTICEELVYKKEELKNKYVEAIYFGGGTPTLLTYTQIQKILDTIQKHYQVQQNCEITMEANPDDLTEKYLKSIKSLNVNRLSIGVQSFREKYLKQMNRSHSTKQSRQSLRISNKYFDNISVDLIYGFPNMSIKQWTQDIEELMSFDVQHISCYALTVEKNTALDRFIKNKKYPALSTDLASKHYYQLIDVLEKYDFNQYEVSNFCKEGYRSIANSSYWLQKPYVGVGPSAHSYDGDSIRKWNVSNNVKYIKAIEENKNKEEKLLARERYNEYIMTRLRCSWGVNLSEVEDKWGMGFLTVLRKNSQIYIDKGLLYITTDNKLKVTKKGLFFCDGIASDLFRVE